MQLITILLGVVSVLVILSGLIVYFGSPKAEKTRSAFFLLSALFATVWSVAILSFLNLSPKQNFPPDLCVQWTFASGILLSITFLTYVAWRRKYGKIVSLLFAIAGCAICALIFTCPHLLYSEIILANSGNSIVLNSSPLLIAYGTFSALSATTIIIMLLINISKTTSSRKKESILIMLISYSISSGVLVTCNLLLPILHNWQFIWLGPLALSVTIVAFYYSVLRYRALNLASRWVKAFSYIVIIASLAVLYMLIFLAIFAILFKGSTPSIEIIILNFIMITAVILSTPAINEVTLFLRSFITPQQIDVSYIVRKLSGIPSSKRIDLKGLAAFLAEQMRFEYVGFLINGQIYGSHPKEIPFDTIQILSELKEPEVDIWQKVNPRLVAWQKADLQAVAVLRNANGRIYGQILIGKPLSRGVTDHHEQIQIESIINLTSVVIGGKIHDKRKRV